MSPSFSRIAVFVFAVSAWLPSGRANEESLVLLQQRAQARAKVQLEAARMKGQLEAVRVASAGLGSMAPITEKGYQIVAAQKNDKEMADFMRRVVEAEGRVVSSEGDLYGMVPYYSGTTMVQTLAGMKKELRTSIWVIDGEGRTAPLTEEGYQQIASLRNKVHMTAFIRRFLDAKNMEVVDENGLSGFIPYYDGEIAVQNLERLAQEVVRAPWASSRCAGELDSSTAISDSKGATVEEDLAKKAFNDFDLNADGFISRAELKTGLGKFERKFSDNEIDNMIVEADSDGDSQINLKEFKVKMQ